MKQETAEKLSILKRKYKSSGFLIIGVFGSFARNEEGPDSDIDILFKISDSFDKKYDGLDYYSKIEDICLEISNELGIDVDLTNLDELDDVGKYFILPEVLSVA